MKKYYFFVFLAGLFLYPITGFAQKTVSIESLLKEMVDRNARARFPDPAFTCGQFSSYDRETVAKDKPGWFANNDRSMFIRMENRDGRKEFVMMDTEGPGAIVRFWMTFSGENCGKGVMRIYIDNDDKPAIEGPAFDILSGNIITGPPLATSVSELTPYERRGHNLYFPVPYAKRCKITYQSEYLFEDDFGARRKGTESVYYNVNYRTYDPSVKVVSYSAQEMKKNQSLIDRIQKQLKTMDRGVDKMNLAQLSMNTLLQPGESKSFHIKGSMAIQHLSMKLEATDVSQALRSTVMEISFDGKKTVWTPAGDFFGIGYHPLYTSTWYTHCTADGQMNAFWVMPFEKECIITLSNLGKQTVSLGNSFAGYASWKWDARSMHFGAAWQQYGHLFLGRETVDVNFATLEGKGVYMGDGIALFNSAYNWWGEGDEKIYIDGETFPSHIGTGTEDYYGYAWCRPEVFTDHPFIAQPYGQGSFDPEYTVNTRFRALDAIPFLSSLIVDMEVYRRRMNYAPVAFWYMMPGGKKLMDEDVAGAKEKVARKRMDLYPAILELGIEGEDLDVPQRPQSGHLSFPTHMKEWSKGSQLLWERIKQGAKGFFSFNCDFPGEYTMYGLFTKLPNSGTFNIYLNDRLLVSKIDLYGAGAASIVDVELGKVTLKQGNNTLVFELVSYPDGQISERTLGVDKLYFIK